MQPDHHPRSLLADSVRAHALAIREALGADARAGRRAAHAGGVSGRRRRACFSHCACCRRGGHARIACCKPGFRRCAACGISCGAAGIRAAADRGRRTASLGGLDAARAPVPVPGGPVGDRGVCAGVRRPPAGPAGAARTRRLPAVPGTHRAALGDAAGVPLPRLVADRTDPTLRGDGRPARGQRGLHFRATAPRLPRGTPAACAGAVSSPCSASGCSSASSIADPATCGSRPCCMACGHRTWADRRPGVAAAGRRRWASRESLRVTAVATFGASNGNAAGESGNDGASNGIAAG